MRIYFLSEKPAALKLDGEFIGMIDKFERQVEVGDTFNIFVEIVPCDNLCPLNFILDESFLSNPLPNTYECLMDGDALIYINYYRIKGFNVIGQINFCGNTFTLFCDGGVFLSCDGEKSYCKEVDGQFACGKFFENKINNLPLLIIHGDGVLIAISSHGDVIYNGKGDNYKCTNSLEITKNFATCAEIVERKSYLYDGEKLELSCCEVKESRDVGGEIIHFAFFESLLYNCDCKKYLCDELKDCAYSIKTYLGDFVAVTVPTDKFYATNGNKPAVGLVYKQSQNLYKVSYCGVELKNNKVTNVYKL